VAVGTLNTCRPVCLLLLAGLALEAHPEEGLDRVIELPDAQGAVYELLEEVTRQSGYLFVYDSRVVDNEQKTEIKKGAYTIRQAIHTLTGNPNLELRIEGEHILIGPPREKESTGYFTLEGRLLDRYTEEAVAYASVGVSSHPLGTVSNANGYFRLRLPDSLSHAVVYFSHLGYLRKDCELPCTEAYTGIIHMEPKVISIQEVVVRLVNPRRAVNNMLNRRETNYADRPVYFTTFYREGVERKKGFVTLTEAVFKVYKTPYNLPPSADRVKLLKMRRIRNENERDTLIAKIKSGIDACLLLDLVKNPPDFLQPDGEHPYDYVHSDLTVVNNRPVNIISFEQKKEVKEPLYKGELFLDAENDALLSARFELHPRYVEKATAMLVAQKSKNLDIVARRVVYNVSYTPWNGRYYVHHIRGDLYFRIRKKSQLFSSSTIHTWFEMVTCRIETENVSRFTSEETLRTRTVFAETHFSYDSDFWDNFNIIPPEEQLSEAIARIRSKVEETQ
jgi:hypothetical protein